MEFKNNLKTLMEKEGLSISQLSRKTGVPVQTLHNWLNGVEPRGLKQLKKVADNFNVLLDYLCFGERLEGKNGEIKNYSEEINTGVFEVVLRRVRKYN